MCCRVDPKGTGHLFLVHGQACLKSATRPQCSFEGGSAPPAKTFVIDVKELMAGDWRVSTGQSGYGRVVTCSCGTAVVAVRMGTHCSQGCLRGLPNGMHDTPPAHAQTLLAALPSPL